MWRKDRFWNSSLIFTLTKKNKKKLKSMKDERRIKIYPKILRTLKGVIINRLWK